MNIAKYIVIASGSKGNAVLIDDVMVDCGVPFNRLKPHLPQVNYLILTHIHSDHINKKTLVRIKKLYPRITVIGNWEVAQEVGVDLIANDLYELPTMDYTFIPVEVPHDVVCYAYAWVNNRDESILYCTDTSSLENISANLPEMKYDYMFLESNHCQHKLEAVRGDGGSLYGYDVYWSGKRHLSTQDAKGFYYTFRRNPEAKFIELHKSSRFY